MTRDTKWASETRRDIEFAREALEDALKRLYDAEANADLRRRALAKLVWEATEPDEAAK